MSFLEGDPDRPLITGSVYNAEQAVPFSLPGSQTQAGLKSNSSKGGGGSNEIRLEDSKGSEELFMHTQKDMNTKVENNQTLNVLVNQDVTIGANQTTNIGSNQTINIGSMLTETVGINYAETVGAAMDLTVGGAMTQSVALSTRSRSAARPLNQSARRRASMLAEA